MLDTPPVVGYGLDAVFESGTDEMQQHGGEVVQEEFVVVGYLGRLVDVWEFGRPQTERSWDHAVGG